MNVPKSIFRQYDVRGIVGRGAHARAGPRRRPRLRQRGVGAAGARADHRRRARQPALGRRALAAASGRASWTPAAPRWTWAPCPRPRSTSPSPRWRPTAGSRSPGSHNPPEFNGFKMVLGSEAFHGDEILELWEIIIAERWRGGARGRRPATARCSGATARAIVRRHRLARPVKVVVDCGNGVGSVIAVEHPAGPRRRGDAAVLRVGRHLPQPSSRSHRPREPAGPPGRGAPHRRRAGHRLRRRCRPDRRGGRDTARSSSATSSWSSSAATRCARFGPGTPVIFDVKCSEVLPTALAQRGGATRSCGRPAIR